MRRLLDGSALIVKRKNDDAERMIARLSDFLRLTLECGHALHAFDVHALDYLLKPIDKECLKELRPYGSSEYIVPLEDGTELKLDPTYRDAFDDFFGGAL